MLLAGDVGGTKTLLGLFAASGERPRPVRVESFRTLDFPDLPTIVSEFLRVAGREPGAIDCACFGVAGPVKDQRARLTNVPWTVDAEAISRKLPVRRVHLINDLEALAWSVPVLERSEIEVLSEGQPEANGAAALIAAGTGLGMALLPKIGGRYVPLSSEGGHTDFAATNESEEVLRSALARQFGRADLEQVLSGPGLENIYRFVYPHQCASVSPERMDEGLAPLISQGALEGGCAACRKAMEMFVAVYGAAAGNLALTALATGGVFIGGGIAPRILPALRWPIFLKSFQAKMPLDAVMRKFPVKVILNPEAGLVGAAAFAANVK